MSFAVHHQAMQDTYASILSLPRDAFVDKLKSGQFADIQGFCKAVFISAKGSRAELESRLHEFKDAQESKEGVSQAGVAAITERRDGSLNTTGTDG